MPTYEFKAPNGKTYEIVGPEGSTPEQAFEQLQSHLSAAPPQRSPLQQVNRSVGLGMRNLIEGAGSSVGMVGDALNTGINMAGQAIGHNPQLGMPSQAFHNALVAGGAPTEENTAERIAGFGASVLGGSRDPLMNALTSRFVQPAPARTLDPRAAAIAEGQAKGFKAPPSLIPGTGNVTNFLEHRVAGTVPLRESLTLDNQKLTNNLTRRMAGLGPTDHISEDAIQTAMTATEAAGYDPIRSLGRLTTGKSYKQALDKVLTDFHGTNSNLPGATSKDVKDLVNGVVTRNGVKGGYRVNSFDSKDAIEAIRTLRRKAFDKSLDTDVRQASGAIARALEDNIELHLSSPGSPAYKNVVAQGGNPAELMKGFKASRVKLAQQNVILQALEHGTGDVNALKIAGNVTRKGENYLTGDLATIGNFAKNAQSVMKVPQLQNPATSHARNGLYTLLATMFGGPLSGAAVAGAPIAQGGVRGLMGTPSFQRALTPTLDPNLLELLSRNPKLINAMPAATNGLFGTNNQ